MSPSSLHAWDLTPDEAIQLQENLRSRLTLAWDGRLVNTVGGADVIQAGEMAHAAITIHNFPSLSLLETVTADVPMSFPYIPGLLAFRAGPAILAAWENLTHKPDLLMIHGHGTAHPRGLGLASHIGLWLELPCIGVAKRRLYGFHAEVGSQVGDWSGLVDEQDSKLIIGAAVCTRLNSRPIYISPGHLVDLDSAIRLSLSCCHSFRLPEPLRSAHRAATT